MVVDGVGMDAKQLRRALPVTPGSLERPATELTTRLEIDSDRRRVVPHDGGRQVDDPNPVDRRGGRLYPAPLRHATAARSPASDRSGADPGLQAPAPSARYRRTPLAHDRGNGRIAPRCPRNVLSAVVPGLRTRRSTTATPEPIGRRGRAHPSRTAMRQSGGSLEAPTSPRPPAATPRSAPPGAKGEGPPETASRSALARTWPATSPDQ